MLAAASPRSLSPRASTYLRNVWNDGVATCTSGLFAAMSVRRSPSPRRIRRAALCTAGIRSWSVATPVAVNKVRPLSASATRSTIE